MSIYYVLHLPSESEALQFGLQAILKKYQSAIRKYCAYSNIEFIKFLMTYSSKKMLTTWDSDRRSIVRNHYTSKSEMLNAIEEFKAIYEGGLTPALLDSNYKVGERVDVNHAGRGKWYSGTISQDHADKTFNVKYDEGWSDMRVPYVWIRRQK
jgi:hypothetical protein